MRHRCLQRRMLLSTVVLLAVLVCAPMAAAPAVAQEPPGLVVAFTVDVQTLDPRAVFTTQGGSMLGHIYEGLVGTDELGRLQPRLAERWEILNPTTIRFHLRKNVKFHNGEAFDAEAVKYSIESRIRPDSRSPQRPFLSAIERVDILNPTTVDVKLTVPAARVVVRNLAYYYGLIVAPRFAQQNADRFTSAVGTGPYRFVEYRPGERLVVERNAAYWGKAPASARITFRIVPEAGTRVAALERGEVDISYNLPIDQVARLRAVEALRVMSRPTVREVYLGFRTDRKPLDDVRVRHALAMLVNPAELNTQLLGGMGRVAEGFVAPEVFGYAKAANRPGYDPARAKELLAQAGQSSFTLRMGISNGRFAADRQIGEAIAAYIEQAGIRVELDAPEFGTFFREIAQPTSKYDAYVLSWATNSLDADFTMTPVFHEKFSQFTMYKNKPVSELIERARATPNEKEALPLYQQIQDQLMREVPWVPLLLVPDVVGARREVEGLQLRADEQLFFSGVGKK